MEEKGAIGVNFIVDLNDFLLGRITSMGVLMDMSSGDIIGVGIDLIIVSCSCYII